MPTPLDTIAHTILPNIMKLKTAATVIAAAERRDASMFAHIWQQTGITHAPQLIAKEIEPWRFGVISLPAPKDMGEAYLAAFVTRKSDPSVARYFTLEYEYVLAKQAAGAMLCEREGNMTRKRGEAATPTGDFQADAGAFISSIMKLLEGRTA